MVSSIRTSYDLCPNVGGIRVSFQCMVQPNAIIHRAGCDSSQQFVALTASLSDGDTYTFVIPPVVFSYPMGYYDMDIYDGDLLKKTIRLNLHSSFSYRGSSVAEAECVDSRMIPPVVENMVHCEDPCAKDIDCCETAVRRNVPCFGGYVASCDISIPVPANNSWGNVLKKMTSCYPHNIRPCASSAGSIADQYDAMFKNMDILEVK